MQTKADLYPANYLAILWQLPIKHVCTTDRFLSYVVHPWFIRGDTPTISASSVFIRRITWGDFTGRDVRANHFGMFKSICADRFSYRTWTVRDITVIQTYIVRKTSAQYAIYPIFICAWFFQYFATKISCLRDCIWRVRGQSVYHLCFVSVLSVYHSC